MDQQHILAELDPAWWVQQPTAWGSTFLSTVILFNTGALTSCSYLSSAEIAIANPTSSSNLAPTNQLAEYTDLLRQAAARRLFDLHATAITGHQNINEVYNATN